jgi:hypothetical protein
MRSLFTAVLVLCATTLAAQTTEPGKLGLNVSFSGEGAGIGTSWRVSPNVTLRPGVVFTWVKTTSPFGGGNESTIWGLGLDVLFRGASWDRVATYVGVGGSYSHANGNAAVGTYQWDARALFGARIRVVDRVWVYGEAGMQYLRSDGFFDAQFSLATFPLGVTIYLK